MATLTATQKSQARRYLGTPDIYRQYDLRLESSFASLSSEGASLVCQILEELEEIRLQLKEARECRLKVGQVEDITFLGPEEIRILWREGNRLAQDLGAALYFEPRRRAFGTRAASWAMGRGAGAGVMRRG